MIRLVRFADCDAVEEHHLVARGAGVVRVVVGPKIKSIVKLRYPNPRSFFADLLGRTARSVYPSPEPSATRVRRNQINVERTTDDRTQRATRVRAKRGVPGIAQITHPPRAVP